MKHNDLLTTKLLPVLKAVAACPRDTVVVALDGPCGGGKSTLAAHLAALTDAALFHTDDFFLRPEQRTPARYAEPGGNVDRERLLAEVLLPLARGEAPSPRRFDCGSMTLSGPVPAPRRRVNILEGSYSLHPALRAYIDIPVFVAVPPETQMRRLAARGSDLAAFRDRWIPLENAYFAACSVRESARFIIDNEEDFA